MNILNIGPAYMGSFPFTVTVLKGGFVKALLQLLLPIVVTITVKGP